MFNISNKSKLTTIKIKIPVFIEKDENGFIAYCPELKGLMADGDTEKEVLDNFANAAVAYIKSLMKHNDPLPVCSATHVEDISTKPTIREIEIPLPVILDNRCNSAV